MLGGFDALRWSLRKAHSMIPGIIPAHNRTIILVRGGRCFVARYRQTAPYRFEVEPAINWQDLEDNARQAVEDLAGAPADDHYPCPHELAARAEWADD